jgi:hypothetical protein
MNDKEKIKKLADTAAAKFASLCKTDQDEPVLFSRAEQANNSAFSELHTAIDAQFSEIDVLKVQVSRLQTTIDEEAKDSSPVILERALYAIDAKRCWELMPELAQSDAHYELHEAVQCLVTEITELRAQAERAEAALKAASEQEPVIFLSERVVADSMRGVRYGATHTSPRIDEEDGLTVPLYTKPTPPSVPDCSTCKNGKGTVNGLSQESYCSQCIYGAKWRVNHYEAKGESK